MTHYKQEFSPVESNDEFQRLLDAISSAEVEWNENIQAALSVAYPRKGYVSETDVTIPNNSYRGYDDEFRLTVQIRVKKNDARMMAAVQPFIDEAISSEAAEKLAAAEAEFAIAQAEVEAAASKLEEARANRAAAHTKLSDQL